MAKQKHAVNLHSGRRADSKTAKYIRLRDADSPCKPELEDAEDWDDDWYDEEGDSADLHECALYHVLHCLVTPPPSVWDALPASATPGEPLIGVPKEELAERLASHIEIIGATSSEWMARDDDYTDELNDRASDALMGLPRVEAEAASRLGNAHPALTNAIVAAVLFHPFWIRRISEWKACAGPTVELRRSLVDHLFTRYPVTEFLYANWQREEEFPRLKWIAWFVLQSQGASLQKAASHFGWRVGGRLQGLLHDTPPDLNTLMGVIWAEVQRLGGDDRVFNRLVSDRSYVIDVTSDTVEQNEGIVEFWEGAVRWLSKHGDQLSDEDAALVLSWAAHQRAEEERARRAIDQQVGIFRWDRLGRARAVREATAYNIEIAGHHQRSRACPQEWTERGWSWESPDKGTWSVKELHTFKELVAEGAVMHHCVAFYDQQCAQGSCVICSLRHRGRRVLTIECNPKRMELVQIRGACNRPAEAVEMQVVSRWWHDVCRNEPEATQPACNAEEDELPDIPLRDLLG